MHRIRTAWKERSTTLITSVSSKPQSRTQDTYNNTVGQERNYTHAHTHTHTQRMLSQKEEILICSFETATLITLHKFVSSDRSWVLTGSLVKFLRRSQRWRIVDAMSAQHVQFLDVQVLLYGAQCLHVGDQK